jgi:hypothetical protein
MQTHEFTLRLGRKLTAEEVDALFNAGLADASIETGPSGTLITFTRQATSWAHAIGSAVADVEKVPGLRVIGAGQDDQVTMLDIARRAGRSREAVRMWAAGKRGPGGFPAPQWESPGGERFWSWPAVAAWVLDKLDIPVDVTPDEIRWADAILNARQAAAEAERALDEADEDTRRVFQSLLNVA